MQLLPAPFPARARVRKDGPTATDAHVDGVIGAVAPFRPGPASGPTSSRKKKRKPRSLVDHIELVAKAKHKTLGMDTVGYARWVAPEPGSPDDYKTEDPYGHKIIAYCKHMKLEALLKLWDKRYPIQDPLKLDVDVESINELHATPGLKFGWVTIGYDPKRHLAVIASGHHRSAYAAQNGYDQIPVRVVLMKVKKKRGSPADEADLPVTKMLSGPVWTLEKAAHDVSDEARDYHGRWTAGDATRPPGKGGAPNEAVHVAPGDLRPGKAYKLGSGIYNVTGVEPKVVNDGPKKYFSVSYTGSTGNTFSDVYPEDYKGFTEVTDVVNAEQASTRATQSVHETGGTRWNGETVEYTPDDPDVRTKRDINARIVDRLTRDMATDPALRATADEYVKRWGLDDHIKAMQTWQGIVGYDYDAYLAAKNKADEQYAAAAQKWAEPLKAYMANTLHLTGNAIPSADYLADAVRNRNKAMGDDLKQLAAKIADPTISDEDKQKLIDYQNTLAGPNAATTPEENAFIGIMMTPAEWDATVKDGPARRISFLEAEKRYASLHLPDPPVRATVTQEFAAPLPSDPRVIALASKVRATIDTWAGSSGDTRPLSIALQLAVADHFNLTDADKKPLQDFADQTSYDDPQFVDENVRPYFIRPKKKTVGELAVGDRLGPDWDGETVTSLEHTAAGIMFNGKYTLKPDQEVTILDPGMSARPNTAWKIARRMVNAEQPFYSHFVTDVYNDTQADLKKHNVTSLLLHRGMHFDNGVDNIPAGAFPPMKSYNKFTSVGGDERITAAFDTDDVERAITQQPLSSWSADKDKAGDFSKYGNGPGIVLSAIVPASRVFSLAASSGVGCLDEREVVIVGGPGTAKVHYRSPEQWKRMNLSSAQFAQLDHTNATDETVMWKPAVGVKNLDVPIEHLVPGMKLATGSLTVVGIADHIPKPYAVGVMPGMKYYDVTMQSADGAKKTQTYKEGHTFSVDTSVPWDAASAAAADEAAKDADLAAWKSGAMSTDEYAAKYPDSEPAKIKSAEYTTPDPTPKEEGYVAWPVDSIHIGDQIDGKTVVGFTPLGKLSGVKWADPATGEVGEYTSNENGFVHLPVTPTYGTANDKQFAELAAQTYNDKKLKQILASYTSHKKAGPPPLYVDAPLHNADWIKARIYDTTTDGSRIVPVIARASVTKARARDQFTFAKVGDLPGHAFHGNQYVAGESGSASPPAATRTFPVIHPADQQGKGRPVTNVEFQALAAEGQAKLDGFAAQRTPHILKADDLAPKTYDTVRQSWGGATIDAHTGKLYTKADDRYAVTTKPPGLQTLAIPEDATPAQYASAFAHALKRFGPELDKAHASLGVFHDDDKHRIEFDPSTIVDSTHDVEAIGAASHAIGGAYHFKSGNGYWPPHVVDTPVIPLHKPLPSRAGNIAVAVGKAAEPAMTHAQFRALRPNADDVEMLTFDDDDNVIDGDDDGPPPLIPLRKAGEGPGHDFRGNQYVTGTSGPEDPTAQRVPMLHMPLPIPTLRGEGMVDKHPVENFLADADHRPLKMGVAELSKLAYLRPGVAAPPAALKTAANFDAAVHSLVTDLVGKENLAEHGLDTLKQHLADIAHSAVDRYTADPHLIEADKFYEQWNHVVQALADENHVPIDRMSAALACISPGTNAALNMRYATDLAHMVAANIALPTEPAARDYFLAQLEDTAKTKAAKPGTAGKELAATLRYGAQLIKSGQATTINDLPGEVAARFAHEYRKANGPQGDVPYDDRMGDDYRKLTDKPGAGFGVALGFGNYAKAINALRGYDVTTTGQRTPFTASDAVQQVKTRNFVNNIMDPHDVGGLDSVTVDYHATNSAFGILGADADRGTTATGHVNPGSSRWTGGISVAGVEFGVRAHVADAIRAQLPYLRKALNDPTLSGNRAQEILWAEWKRGLDQGTTAWSGKYQPPVWRAYNGDVHSLLDLRTPESAKKKSAPSKAKKKKP